MARYSTRLAMGRAQSAMKAENADDDDYTLRHDAGGRLGTLFGARGQETRAGRDQ